MKYRKFQFPSNGKPDQEEPSAISRQPSAKTQALQRLFSFLTAESREPKAITQFPSNGKDYPKRNQGNADYMDKEFQFPSNGKDYPKEA